MQNSRLRGMDLDLIIANILKNGVGAQLKNFNYKTVYVKTYQLWIDPINV